MSRSKQTPVRDLFAKQNPFEVRRLAAAFIEMVGALKSRPEPRSWWDNVASPDRADPKGLDAVLAGRIAINAAITTRDTTMIEETAARVGRYFETMRAVALAPYTALANKEISPRDAKIRASKETTEALHAIYTAPDAGVDARTIQEIDEAIEAMSNVRAALITHSAPAVERRTHMGLLS